MAFNTFSMLLTQFPLRFSEEHSLCFQLHRQFLHLVVLLLYNFGVVSNLLLTLKKLKLKSIKLAFVVASLLLSISVQELSDLPDHVFKVMQLKDFEHALNMTLEFLVLTVELQYKLDVFIDVIAQVVFLQFTDVALFEWIAEVRFNDTAQRVVAFDRLDKLLLFIEILILQLKVLLAVALLFLPSQHFPHLP